MSTLEFFTNSDELKKVMSAARATITAPFFGNNVEEVKSRGAKVYVISTKALAKDGDAVVVDDFDSYMSSIIISTIAFYLAYFVSLLKGYNVDKPRNLAKSVTVE